MYISMKCSLYVCLSECDKIAKWQFFTSRYIFLNQVFYIHGKFLCIYMSKQFIPCQCDLLTMKCFFFFACQFTCTIFIHQEGLVMSSGLTTGESGNRPQEKQHGGGLSSFSTRKSFSQVSCLFSVNAPHARMCAMPTKLSYNRDH